METTFDNLPAQVAEIAQKLDQLMEAVSLQGSQTESDELMTTDEVAEFLRLSVATIYSLVSRGRIPHLKRSKRLYFERGEIIKWLRHAPVQHPPTSSGTSINPNT